MAEIRRRLDRFLRAGFRRRCETLLVGGLHSRLLTTNSLIRPGEVFTRSGGLVRPDSRDPANMLTQTRGLAGIHRKTLLGMRENLDPRLR